MSFLFSLHLLFALVSLIGLVGRSVLKIKHSELLQHKLVKILPHVNDTLLLLAGVSMAVSLNINPMKETWLMVKLIGILIYIGIGVYTIKTAKTDMQILLGCLGAISVFIWIASVAVLRSPLGFFTLL